MEKISINLLPEEFTQEEVKKTKFYKVQAIGVGIIMVLIFLASLTVALRILQSQNIQSVQAQVSQSEQRVSDLKNRQASLTILKDRLAVISQYAGKSSPQATSLRAIEQFLPSSLVLTSLAVTKTGEVLIVGLVPDVISLDNFITDLTTIGPLSIENLTRGRDTLYRISLKIKPR